jgi:hypothetical protein
MQSDERFLETLAPLVARDTPIPSADRFTFLFPSNEALSLAKPAPTTKALMPVRSHAYPGENPCTIPVRTTIPCISSPGADSKQEEMKACSSLLH